MEITDTTTTAVRVLRWPDEPIDCAGQLAGITVTFADGTTRKVNGARAKRAQAVLVTEEPSGGRKVACRADWDAAVREAERMSNPSEARTRFGRVPMPAQPTVAVRVTDA